MTWVDRFGVFVFINVGCIVIVIEIQRIHSYIRIHTLRTLSFHDFSFSYARLHSTCSIDHTVQSILSHSYSSHPPVAKKDALASLPTSMSLSTLPFLSLWYIFPTHLMIPSTLPFHSLESRFIR